MTRAIFLAMDSLANGAAANALRYGDVRADPLGHILEACAAVAAGSRLRARSLSVTGR